MNAQVKTTAPEPDYEDVFTKLDTFLRGSDSYREMKLRPVDRGFVCSLYSGGNPVAQGRGANSDSAIWNALELAPQDYFYESDLELAR